MAKKEKDKLKRKELYKELNNDIRNLKSDIIDSPWPYPHAGKVYEPNYRHLLEVMKDVAENFKAYSGYYYAQSTKIHEDYNWLQLTNNSFEHIFKKFS